MKIKLGLLMILLAGGLSGCQTYYTFARYERPGNPDNWLYNHRSPMVRIPSETAEFIFALPGIPLDLVNMLLMEGITPNPLSMDKDELEMLECTPHIISGTVGEYGVGVPCWAIFGWWWPEAKPYHSNYEQKTKSQRSSVPSQ